MKSMDIIKELTNGPGYAVFPVENMDIFKTIRDNIVSKINIHEEAVDNIDLIRKAMTKMSNSEINKSMVNLLKFNYFSEMIIDSCPNLIKTLCGKKLFIQRRAHTVVKLPGEKQLKTLPHYEMMSGISPFTYIIWAPLHDIDDKEGGIYYLDKKKSSEIMKKEQKEGLVNGPTILNMKIDKKPSCMKFGEAIIFSPFVMHGNNTFNSEFARIAINTRFQSYNKPLLQKNTDYLKYYQLP